MLVGYVVKGINSHLMFLLQTYNRNKFASKQHSKYTNSVDIKTHTNTHARTHARTHTLTVCSRNWVLILVGMKILWEEEGFQFGFKRRRRRHTVRGICCLRPLIVSVRPMHWPCLTDELKVRQSMLDQWNWKRWVSAREPEWNSHCYSDEVGIK